MLDGTVGDINKEQDYFLKLAKRNVDRLHRLINNVLDFAKLESGNIDFQMVENDINSVINDVVNNSVVTPLVEYTVKL